MNHLTIEKTKKTPSVSFHPQKGIIEISGRSIPEDAFSFYEPLLNWIESYSQDTKNTKTEIVINLDYYNTSSSMYLLNILKILDDLAGTGHSVVLKWYFDEEDKEGWVEVLEESLSPFLKHMKYEIVHRKTP
ncbi:MAG: DUF1987 domain-containing protein [Cytophagales bacterium]|nr:MAG: DUF1987 domain-containing protein [Cytophagales bacterium]